MPYLNLKAEMAKRDVTIESVSNLLGVHRNSVANKIKGNSRFSVDEAFCIQKAFFPDLETHYLFETEETSNSSIRR